MNILTGAHISRRKALRGIGATIALPLLDAMLPAGRAWSRYARRTLAGRTRLVAIEICHGAAGSNKLGAEKFLWAPELEGSEFDLTPSSLSPLEPHRDFLTIVSNTDVRGAEAVEAREVGGDHFRSSAAYLTQAHPKQTEGSDVRAGTSMDQLYAQRFGQDTPIPSMQLCIENVDQSGGCAYGYACVYTDTISWASPTTPMPMIRDPRVVFDQLFGAGSTPKERAARRQTDKSVLDWVAEEVARVQQGLGATDQQRMASYLQDIREVERRIQKTEQRNRALRAESQGAVSQGAVSQGAVSQGAVSQGAVSQGAVSQGAVSQGAVSTENRQAPAGVPESFDEHVKLMFDLQILALQADLTRVISFKMGRDGSARVYPETGVKRGFHPASHHGGRERTVLDFSKINRYHVSTVGYFLDKMKKTTVGETNLLEQSMVLYGSPMGDSNLHNHKRCPLILCGHANGKLPGNRHVKAPDGTPMADVMLDALHMLGLEDLKSFGDSTGQFSL